jgi:UDP-GlcNAc:undecaprenyl-phosphate GlcNAc-1-phosphate transferase
LAVGDPSAPGLLGLLLAGAALAVFLLSVILTAVARRVALYAGFVDHPGGHKSHRTPMPYGGGCAILLAAWLPLMGVLVAAAVVPGTWVARVFGATTLAYVGGMRSRAVELATILVGGVVLHLLGLADDRRPLRATSKLLVIMAVAVLVATVGRVRLAEFAGVPLSVLCTTVWFIVIVNAFNFLDNMDGLSAGVAGICLLFVTICGLMAGQVLVPALGCVCLGAVGGFLVFNFPPARIFMGDAGSLLIGYMLAVVSVLTTYFHSGVGVPPYALVMPLVILAVPLYDFASVVVLRLLEGRNPMIGDQRHFSHRLVERGLSRRLAVLTIYLATATTGLTATLLPEADLRRTLTIGVIVLMVLAIIAILEAPLRKEP